jgi:hypothetical protein
MASLDKFKLSLVTWDSDKDQFGFQDWMDQMSSIVRSTPYGDELEGFLDHKLDRVEIRRATIPSFLTDDPDFDPPSDPSLGAGKGSNPPTGDGESKGLSSPRIDISGEVLEDESESMAQKDSESDLSKSDSAHSSAFTLGKASKPFSKLAATTEQDLKSCSFSTWL